MPSSEEILEKIRRHNSVGRTLKDELEAALAAEEAAEEEAVPDMLAEPNIEPLRKMVGGIIRDMASGKWHEDNDDAHYVYEAAITAFYGKSIWEWYRKHQ